MSPLRLHFNDIFYKRCKYSEYYTQAIIGLNVSFGSEKWLKPSRWVHLNRAQLIHHEIVFQRCNVKYIHSDNTFTWHQKWEMKTKNWTRKQERKWANGCGIKKNLLISHINWRGSARFCTPFQVNCPLNTLHSQIHWKHEQLNDIRRRMALAAFVADFKIKLFRKQSDISKKTNYQVGVKKIV